MIGGSDFLMGCFIDHLDRERYEPVLFAPSVYPTDRVLQIADSIEHVHFPAGAPVGQGVDADDGEIINGSATSPARKPARSLRQHAGSVYKALPAGIRRRVGFLRDAQTIRRLTTRHAIKLFHSMDGGPLAAPIGAKLAGARTLVEYSAPRPTPTPIPSRGGRASGVTRAPTSASP